MDQRLPGDERHRAASRGARLAPVLCAAAAWLCACSTGGGSDATLVRDSAGIRIVENRAPLWRAGEGWRVVEPPLVEIGVADGDERYQLFDVRRVVRLSDGRIVVLNTGTSELRWYDAAGRFLTRAGGKGGGPGEFNIVEFIAVLAGDSILAFDGMPPRASVFDPAGLFVRDLTFPRPASRRVWVEFAPSGLLTGLRLVVWSQPIYGFGYHDDFADGVNRLPHPVGVAHLGAGRFDSIAAAPGWEVWVERLEGGGSQMAALPFARSSDIVGAGERILIAPTDDVSIYELDATGALRGIIRGAEDPVPVRRRDWDAWVRELYEQFPMTPEQRVEGDRLLAAMPIPARMPAFRGIDVDRGGNVWVHDYPRPGLAAPGARVFDADGRLLGSVALPAGLKRAFSREPYPLDIGEDWILGVWTDPLGVEYVRLYRLEKPDR